MGWRKIAYAVGGGVSGLIITLLARGIALLTALSSTGFFSSPSVSISQTLVLYLVVPGLIIVGGALTALGLGSSKRRSLISGVAALVIGIYFDTGHHSYSPFNERETLAFIAAAAATVVFALLGRSLTKGLIAVISISAALAFLSIYLPVPGFFAALVAWILLPAVAAFFST